MVCIMSVLSGISLYIPFVDNINWVYLGIVLIILAFMLLISDNLLTFLTIKKTFITRLIITSALVFLGLFITKYIVNGSVVMSGHLGPFDFGAVQIKRINYDKYISMLFQALIISFINNIYNELNKNGK